MVAAGRARIGALAAGSLGTDGPGMSFRGRLRLFFILIVVVPMIALAIVLFALTARSETGKADAGIASGVRTAFAVHKQQERQTRDEARRVATDPELRAALVENRLGDARERIRELVGGDVEAIEIRSPSGAILGQAGTRSAVAPSGTTVEREDGRQVALLRVFATEGSELVGRVRQLTGLDGTVFRRGRSLGTTLDEPPERSAHGATGEPREVEAAGTDYRGRIEPIPEPGGAPIEVGVLQPAAVLNDRIARDRILIAVLLGVFLVLALLSALLIGRSLTGQIGAFLVAAKRLGRGDFRQPVPVHGDDEFARLGREFNSMSGELVGKIEEVERRRGELEETIRRVGEALATGLDRQGVMELAVKQAVDACEAESGRALTLDTAIFNGCDAGRSDPVLEEALEASERAAFAISPEVGAELLDALDAEGGQVLQSSRRRAVASEARGAHALTVVLRHVVGPPEYLGALSIARHDRAFDRTEAELLEYLAGQAVVSIENASLHATVERQAVTDELTGLANTRAFWSILAREAERSRRFGSPLGLVMLDIDDFKQVNDHHGHQQGDEVLAHVARVLRDFSRDIDAPARYGGEEMAVILPETDLRGASQLAERVREAVASMQVPGAGGGGSLRVTASFGVAAAPDSAVEPERLVAAADAALYRAKRAGKNRVERAAPAEEPTRMAEPEPSTPPR
jgi:diguanylate cyclase (GGDEF)-like protein